MQFTVDANRVYNENGDVAEFEFPVKEIVQFDPLAIVVLDVPPTAVMTENVFCVNTRCEVLWQVERTAATASDPTNVYVGASRIEGQPHLVSLTNWNGIAVRVEVATGKVVSTIITK